MLRREYLKNHQGNEDLKNAITNISHDLRTPMAVIAAQTELALEQDMPDELREAFELIQKQDSEEWVRRIRKQCGLTVDAFARYIGVSRSTVNSWETHQNCRKPSRESFNRIVEMAKMRGVDIYDPWRTETLADTEAPV